MQASPASRARLSSDMPTSQPAWMALTRGHRQHWSQRQQQQQAQQQQQPSQQPNQPHSGGATVHDTVDVLAPPGSHPQLCEWRRLWELASAAYFNRQHRVLWWRILHGCVMCGAFSAYIGRATVEQACCPYACCSSPAQPQTISHMFLECPMAATVISWLCRLWQAMTGHLPDASVATILAASTSEGQCASDALLQTWHRLRLAVLHSIWTAARIAASSTHASSQASQLSSQSHLASRLALKTVTSMIHHDWVKCNDDVRQLAGVCSSWLRGRDPSMTLEAFRNLWCHHDTLASIHTAHTGTGDKLELVVNLSDMVLAASLWYHATFQRPPEQLLQQISRQLTRYVASAQHHSQGDAAVALAQGNSQDSAALPAPASSAALFPRVLTSSLLPAQGGVGLVEVPTQIQALQSKVVSRLLEPERLAWKVFQLHHLSHAPQPSQLAYGATILFSTASTASLQLPARLMGYVTAFRALQPHRLLPVSDMPAEAILNEPLFFNQQIPVPLSRSATSGASGSMGSQPFTPQDQPLLLAAGLTKAVATATPTAPAWRQGVSSSGIQLIQNTHTGQQHSVSLHSQLLQAPAQAIFAFAPVHVIPWDPSRPWRGPTQQPAQSTVALYSQGPLYGPDHLSLGVWGWGQQPGHQLVVRQASQRLRLIQARKHGILAPGTLTCQPRLLPSLGSDLTPAEVLQALESRWTASMQASPASRARLSSDMPTSQPAWMALTRGHRQHWSQRQQQQQAQQQQQPSQQPNQPHSGGATVHDTMDVLAPPGSHPQLSEWRRLWELAREMSIPLWQEAFKDARRT
ncbi:hypothetical protein ABBQ38_001542 [Trebouxia sp. C0009 RCD-2024]